MLIDKYQIPTLEKILPEFKLGKHILILGSTGSGKTNFIIWLYYQLSKKYKCIFYNPIGHLEIEKLSEIVLNEKDVLNSNEFEKRLYDISINTISITPTEKFITDKKGMRILWNEICKSVYFYEDLIYTKLMEDKGKKKNIDFKRRANLILFNDELMFNLEKEKIEEYHHAILHRGQNFKITHIGNTQRNQYISKLITTQSQYKIIFQLDKFDISALKDKIKNIELVEFLNDYHFLRIYKDRKIDFFKPIQLLKED